MDSLTQAVLGAAVAEVGMGGRRLGNKAAVWGAVLGTLPDLDIVAFPWLDAIQRLEWHRGLSHSLLLMAVASPLIGWGLHRIYTAEVTWSRAAWTVFWIWFTHVLIDVFTVYGTMVFEPFSDYRLGFNNLFIIDPLFTLPILIGLGVAVLLKANSAARRRWNQAGLALASVYVAWSFVAKSVADGHFQKSLAELETHDQRWMSGPTPFNTLLWRCVALAPGDEVWIGYYSLLDGGRPVRFERYPMRSALLEGLADERVIRRLRWFSDGYLGARTVGGDLVVSDWRFGEAATASGAGSEPLPFFSWKIEPTESGSWLPVSVRPVAERSRTLSAIWRRIFDPDTLIAASPDQLSR